MKRNIFKVLFLAVIVGFSASCTKDFEEINIDPTSPVTVPTSYILTSAQTNTVDLLRDTWLNGRMGMVYSQYWSQVNYTDEGRYAPRVTITNSYWGLLYRTMYDFQDIINKNSGDKKLDFLGSGDNVNQVAVAKIMKSYVMHIMTDIWGDIPYTEALNPENIYAKFDDQETVVYPGLIADLQAAIAMINTLPTVDLKGDAIYDGDMTKWKKFAHSLIMRIALRMGDNTLASAQLANAFSSNADNAMYTYTASGATKNPLFVDFVEGGRLAKDFAVSKTLLDYMNIDSDPRRPFYATPVGGAYVGLSYGLNNSNAPTEFALGRSVQAASIYAADATTPLMTYDEVLFINAEINPTAANLQAAVEASCMNWGSTASDATIYALATIARNGVSQNSIVTEKWVALYMQGMQGWAEYRRTGYPDFLVSPVDGLFQGVDIGTLLLPARRPYPEDEGQLNEANYKAAVAKLNDAGQQKAKMFWAK